MTDEKHAQTLYVVFHGSFAFYQTSGSILALIPDMGSEHAYLAGPWLGETTLEPGSAHALTGVKGGGGKFSRVLAPSCQIDLTGASGRGHGMQHAHGSMAMSGSGLYSMLLFPRPIAVHELCKGVFHPGSIHDLDRDTSNTEEVYCPYVPVFEYTHKGKAALGSHWQLPPDKAAAAAGESPTALTLHILSTAPKRVGPEHVRMAFQNAMRLLGRASELKLEKDDSIEPAPDNLQVPLPDYFQKRPFELQPLQMRNDAVRAIAVEKQALKDLSDPWSSLIGLSAQALTRRFFFQPVVDHGIHAGMKDMPGHDDDIKELGVDLGCECVTGAGGFVGDGDEQ
jgi:hypothetical protein